MKRIKIHLIINFQDTINSFDYKGPVPYLAHKNAEFRGGGSGTYHLFPSIFHLNFFLYFHILSVHYIALMMFRRHTICIFLNFCIVLILDTHIKGTIARNGFFLTISLYQRYRIRILKFC